MSTRSQIHFTDKYGADANIYRQCDGYPEGDEGVPADLGRFFAAVERANSEQGDTRFNHAEYLAARFVAWLTLRHAREDGKDPLSVIGIGIMAPDAEQGAYIYRITCTDDPAEWPAVAYRHAGEKRFRSIEIPVPAPAEPDDECE